MVLNATAQSSSKNAIKVPTILKEKRKSLQEQQNHISVSFQKLTMYVSV